MSSEPLDPGEVRRARGPVLRKGPGPSRGWTCAAAAVGHCAFSLNRVHRPRPGLSTSISIWPSSRCCCAGESAWHGFLRLATTPAFLGLDVLLIFGLLFHGLNGLRVALVGSRLAPDRQRRSSGRS